MAAAVLLDAPSDSDGPRYADFRALGFDDAGPLPRYSARVRPGLLRRLLTTLLLPGPRAPSGVEVVAKALPEAAERALRERLAPEFGALPFAAADLPESGLHLTRNGGPVATCRFRPPTAAGAELAVVSWIAPPEEPDLTALLARGALTAAGRVGAAGASFETTHRGLGKGLLLARFLPRRSRARVLVRTAGERGGAVPSTDDWHLTAPTVIGCGGLPEAL